MALTCNSSIYLENITRAQSLYEQRNAKVKEDILQQLTTKIKKSIESNHIYYGNVLNIDIRIRGIIYVNDVETSAEKYMSSPEVKDQINNKLHTQGSSAISLHYISVTPNDFIRIDSKDEASAQTVGGCCCCCPCFFIPYFIYQLWRGQSYHCIVRIKINDEVLKSRQTTDEPAH